MRSTSVKINLSPFIAIAILAFVAYKVVTSPKLTGSPVGTPEEQVRRLCTSHNLECTIKVK